MQRYILDNETKTFYKNDLHHIKNVMRMKTGDKVITCLNKECAIVELNITDNVTFNVVEQLPNSKINDITLIQGLIKGTKIETTIKYATIFGATAIELVPFERSIVKLKNNDNKLDRYFSIAKEAAELAHRESIPVLTFSESLKKVDWNKFDIVILADEEEQVVHLKDIVNEELLKKRIAIIVGPEGGISHNERNYLKKLGCLTISLGKYIFPAEIAAISLLNTLNM